MGIVMKTFCTSNKKSFLGRIERLSLELENHFKRITVIPDKKTRIKKRDEINFLTDFLYRDMKYNPLENH